MTTDTKAVARFDTSPQAAMWRNDVSGDYVYFEEHEDVVAELRSALAAKSAEVEGLAKDAERWRYLDGRLIAADFTMDDCVGLTFKLPAGSAVSANAGETVDSAMEKANDH